MRFIPAVSSVRILLPLPGNATFQVAFTTQSGNACFRKKTVLYGPVVKRLRHRPFTAVSRVRFPSGSPNKTLILIPYVSRLVSCFFVGAYGSQKWIRVNSNVVPIFSVSRSGWSCLSRLSRISYYLLSSKRNTLRENTTIMLLVL